MADIDDYVEVLITAQERVRYRQKRKIRRSEWELYNRMIEEDAAEHEFDSHFAEFLDETDFVGDGIEDVEMELAAPTPKEPKP